MNNINNQLILRNTPETQEKEPKIELIIGEIKVNPNSFLAQISLETVLNVLPQNQQTLDKLEQKNLVLIQQKYPNSAVDSEYLRVAPKSEFHLTIMNYGL
jgi:hypothetical protein